MLDALADFFAKWWPGLSAPVLGLGGYSFYRRHLLDLELSALSAESFVYVPDDEKNSDRRKIFYHALVKVTLSISVSRSLGYKGVVIYFRDGDNFFQLHTEGKLYGATRHEDFFSEFGESVVKDGDESLILTVRGIAQRTDSPFPWYPAGGYDIFAVLSLQRFLVVVPCRFASLRDSTLSVMRDEIKVVRTYGNSLNVEDVLKSMKRSGRKRPGISFARLMLADFDFVPIVSPYLWLKVKTNRPAMIERKS